MAHVFVLEEPKLTVFSLRNTNKTLPRELHFLQFVLVFWYAAMAVEQEVMLLAKCHRLPRGAPIVSRRGNMPRPVTSGISPH